MGAILLDRALPPMDQGKGVCIGHPPKHCRKVCDIVGLSKGVPVYESGEAAKANV